MIPKVRIQKSLRVFGGDNEKIWVPKIEIENFYIETEENNLNIWGSYHKDKKIYREGVGISKFFFPAKCPRNWLTKRVQSSPFYVLEEGATTPLGHYSRIDKYENLEEVLAEIEKYGSRDWIESHYYAPKLVSPGMYGINALFLGREANQRD